MSDLQKRFIAARRRAIALEYSHLNPRQREGVLATEGPLLLLAGAGSGKTTVLINRVANLLRYGRGSDCDEIPIPISIDEVEFLEQYISNPDPEQKPLAQYLCAVEPARPWEVLAITFTNKAAGELKERLERMLGADARDIWAATFHSACVRILRRDIDKIGFDRSFTIYDTDDSKRVIKDILKELNLEEKSFPVREVLSIISGAKDKMQSAETFAAQAESRGDWRKVRIAKVYAMYNRRLRDANALDFDDIILHTVHLLQQSKETLEYYQNKFRYILIDEYQDTNQMQYMLASLLAGGHGNICVVGDDDQSIYRFRGADIGNILSFEKQYRKARVIRLEQNYRSTQNILDAANAVIRNNQGRKGKTLWTENGSGDLVTIKTAFNEGDEANFVVGQIMMNYNRGANWRDHAILYRTNAQSNALEYAFKRNAIPYRIIGGTRFFDRAEVKDMLAYLCVINNRNDDLRLTRIINNPPRGIGPKALAEAQRMAQAEGSGLYKVINDPYSYGPLEKSAGKFLAFTSIIEELAALLEEGMLLTEFYDQVLIKTGYAQMLEDKPSEENKTRLENVKELKSSIASYLQNAEVPSLAGFLEEIALYTDIEQYNDSDDAVVMMTMHSAKGLEFPNVYLVGFEDGLFPGTRAIGDREEMEEERRLCYVAITRAKKNLTISYARQRMLYGRTTPGMQSRFLKEIPDSLTVKKGSYVSAYSAPGRYSYYDDSGYTPPKPANYVPKIPAPTSQSASKAPAIALNKGDMVQHTAFGKGMVLSVLKMGGDAMLEVAFDKIGTKKLMLNAAAAHLKKLS